MHYIGHAAKEMRIITWIYISCNRKNVLGENVMGPWQSGNTYFGANRWKRNFPWQRNDFLQNILIISFVRIYARAKIHFGNAIVLERLCFRGIGMRICKYLLLLFLRFEKNNWLKKQKKVQINICF